MLQKSIVVEHLIGYSVHSNMGKAKVYMQKEVYVPNPSKRGGGKKEKIKELAEKVPTRSL